MRVCFVWSLLCLCLTLTGCGSEQAVEEPVIRPKVMIISPWEIGDVSGDRPGEYQFWVERQQLDTIIPFPAAAHDIRMNNKGLAAVNTGPGVTNSAIVITALGLDRRFDFSDTYWIIAGVAGGDPEDVSIGSAAWARWVVDGDLMRAIDSKETPDDWNYGLFPTDGNQPNDRSGGFTYPNMVFELNQDLVNWAYENTKKLTLADHPEVQAFRDLFVNNPIASGPPRVVMGESLGSNAYWHGKNLTRWANDWVRLYTGGRGNFVMTNVEDNGTLRALHRLEKLGKVDMDRILVLRVASNYSHQPDNENALWSLTAEYPAEGIVAFENLYRVASHVSDLLIAEWSDTANTIPSMQ